MSAWIRGRRVRRWLAVLCALATVGAVSAANASTGSPQQPEALGDRAVTLLTGDRVRVVGDAVLIEPGRGRERMAFDVRSVNGHRHVVPADALGRRSSAPTG